MKQLPFERECQPAQKWFIKAICQVNKEPWYRKKPAYQILRTLTSNAKTEAHINSTSKAQNKWFLLPYHVAFMAGKCCCKIVQSAMEIHWATPAGGAWCKILAWCQRGQGSVLPKTLPCCHCIMSKFTFHNLFLQPGMSVWQIDR